MKNFILNGLKVVGHISRVVRFSAFIALTSAGLYAVLSKDKKSEAKEAEAV
jgi:hypothetical protein